MAKNRGTQSDHACLYLHANIQVSARFLTFSRKRKISFLLIEEHPSISRWVSPSPQSVMAPRVCKSSFVSACMCIKLRSPLSLCEQVPACVHVMACRPPLLLACLYLIYVCLLTVHSCARTRLRVCLSWSICFHLTDHIQRVCVDSCRNVSEMHQAQGRSFYPSLSLFSLPPLVPSTSLQHNTLTSMAPASQATRSWTARAKTAAALT